MRSTPARPASRLHIKRKLNETTASPLVSVRLPNAKAFDWTKGDLPAEPSASQRATFAYLKENVRSLADLVLGKILEIYPDEKRNYEESVDESWPKLPEITTIAGLSDVIGPPTIHIGDNTKQPGAPGTIGFAFDCAWDEEHQFSVLTWNGQISEYGDGNVAGFIRE